MTNKDNLTPWQPGRSGNPAGKPKGTRHLRTIIQEMLDDPKFSYEIAGQKKKGRAAEAIIRALMIKAINGDVKAFDALAKYGYGTRHDITSDGKPLPVPLLGGLTASEAD